MGAFGENADSSQASHVGFNVHGIETLEVRFDIEYFGKLTSDCIEDCGFQHTCSAIRWRMDRNVFKEMYFE